MTEKNSQIQIDGTLISPGQLNFHPILKDIEEIFWFFILSHKALTHPSVQNIIKKEKDPNIISMLDKYNRWVDPKIKSTGVNKFNVTANLSGSMVFFGKAMAILTYDFLSASKYNTRINRDEEFQFLRHVRNGAAHNNKFNLKNIDGSWKIEKNKVIKWNKLEIKRDLQGKTVFNDFIALPSIFLLAENFSERLIKIDKKNK
jgi:hypothetical protein